MPTNREFLSKQTFDSAALGEVFQRAQKNLSSFQSGRLEYQCLGFTSSDGMLPFLAPPPAIVCVFSFDFEAIIPSSPDLSGRLITILQLAQNHFGNAVDCELRCHQPDGSRKQFIHYSGVVSFEWTDGEAFLNYCPDDVKRFAPVGKVVSPDDYRVRPKLYAEVFRQIVRACEAPVKVVSTAKTYHFKPLGEAKCGSGSAGYRDGYGGPYDLHWQLVNLVPQEQFDRLERALAANGCPHPRVWSLHVSTRIWSGLQDFRLFYELIRSAGWPLADCRGGVGLQIGGPHYLDALLPLLKDDTIHRHPTAGHFDLPAQTARGKPRRGNLCVLSTKGGHRLSVRLKEDLAKYLPRIEKALGLRFQR
jgi:hypothetical protein